MRPAAPATQADSHSCPIQVCTPVLAVAVCSFLSHGSDVNNDVGFIVGHDVGLI